MVVVGHAELHWQLGSYKTNGGRVVVSSVGSGSGARIIGSLYELIASVGGLVLGFDRWMSVELCGFVSFTLVFYFPHKINFFVYYSSG